MELDRVIKERHSVRSYKRTKKPDYKKVIEIINSGLKAPLAGNISSIKCILVTNKEKIKELAQAAQQEFLEETDFIIVVCTDKKILEKHYYERGKTYARQQAGAIIENMLLKTTDLGLASCWIGAFADDMVKRILKIPTDIDVEALLPIGYELGKVKQQRKPELDNALFFDEWKNKYMRPRKIIESTST